MEEWDLTSFVRDLSSFINLVEKYDLPIETSGLSKLEGKLQYCSSLEFSISDIEFTMFESISGTNPSEINAYSIFFSHDCCLDDGKDFSKQDPFKNIKGYFFQINMHGYVMDEDVTFHSTMRLDRHIEGGNKANSCHPFYHFHFGGDELLGKNTGELMLTTSPRLAHPPMDLFLGIHFILDNYFNKKTHNNISDLMEDTVYKDIISNAQKRLWVPYFNAFKEIPESHEDYTIKNIFPLYIG